MVFSSAQDINYFSFSGHTRRRRSSWCGVRVMSSRVPRASTWSADTHALPLCHLALCMCCFGRCWRRINHPFTCPALVVTPLLLPFACFPHCWTSELMPRSCLFNIIACVAKGDLELNRTFGACWKCRTSAHSDSKRTPILAHSSPF